MKNVTVINVKKLQFNHVLTTTCIDLHIENSKNDKKVILATITSTKCQCAGAAPHTLFILVLHCGQAPILSPFGDIGP